MSGLPPALSRIILKHKNKTKMKKLLFVAIIGALVSCGEATTATDKVDSVVTPTTDTVPAVVDTTKVADSTVAPAVDSVKK
ncbi:MAG: hypothetical protein EAY75_13155 [Bacteroidetes bacterium]|nr:MAG: hypothetical protein EAY75_13155 [Bacteroidota bacterium]